MTKMLVVDDEIEICDFLKTFFEERNYKVLTALNGETALKLVNQERPAIVLLDIKMPGCDGIEVLKKIKQAHPLTKVIMVTAIETREKIEEALRFGADNYITKPLSLEYLEKDVRDKLEQMV
ncbi:MAG TPA: response regulator [Candidatus Omnitrophota bacterium]|nr:response regulator [Candidatus Omnitrophota bacterium]